MYNKNILLTAIAMGAVGLGVVGCQKVAVSESGMDAKSVIEVEAESFFRKDLKTFTKDFYVFDAQNKHEHVKPDPDEPHLEGASGGAYLEILPDTRVTHDDKLIPEGVNANFYPVAGDGPEVAYKVQFAKSGRYYVWVRAHSTGPEDNGVHVGLNGSYPESGARVQWCWGKQRWTWSNGQRTEADHCGSLARIFIDVPKAGEHILNLAAREDGVELDKIILTMDPSYHPDPEALASEMAFHKRRADNKKKQKH